MKDEFAEMREDQFGLQISPPPNRSGHAVTTANTSVPYRIKRHATSLTLALFRLILHPSAFILAPSPLFPLKKTGLIAGHQRE